MTSKHQRCRECRHAKAVVYYRGRYLCAKCAIKLYHPHLKEKAE